MVLLFLVLLFLFQVLLIINLSLSLSLSGVDNVGNLKQENHATNEVKDPVGNLWWGITEAKKYHIFTDNSVLDGLPSDTKFNVFLNSQGGADFHGIHNGSGGDITPEYNIKNPTLAKTWIYNGINYTFGDISSRALRAFSGRVTFNQGILIRMDKPIPSNLARITSLNFILDNVYKDISFMYEAPGLWTSLSYYPGKSYLFDNVQTINIDTTHLSSGQAVGFTVANRIFWNSPALRQVNFRTTQGSNVTLIPNLFYYAFGWSNEANRTNTLEFKGYDGIREKPSIIKWKHIGSHVFYRSNLIGTIDFSNSSRNVFEKSNDWPDEELGSSFKETNINSLVLPEGITSLPEETFKKCQNLWSLTIPKSLTSFGNEAFANCENMNSIYLNWGKDEINHLSFADQNTFAKSSSSTGVYMNYDPMTTDFNELRDLLDKKITDLGTQSIWKWILRGNQLSFVLPEFPEFINLQGDGINEQTVTYRLSPQFTEYLKANPNLTFKITDESWPSDLPPSLHKELILNPDKTELYLRYSFNGHLLNSFTKTFNPKLVLTNNSGSVSRQTWPLNETTINITEDDSTVVASDFLYYTPSEPDEPGLWLNGDQANFSLTIPVVLLDGIESDRDLVQRFNEIITTKFSDSTLTWQTGTTGNDLFLMDGDDQIANLEVHLDQRYIDVNHFKFYFILQYNALNEHKRFHTGLMTFKVNNSPGEDPNIKIKFFAKDYFDPKVYAITPQSNHITLDPTTGTGTIVYNIPASREEFDYNSYKWHADKGRIPIITQPTLSDNEYIRVDNFVFNGDYTKLTANVRLLKQDITDHTVNLNAGSVTCSGYQTTAMPSIDIVVPGAEREINASDVSYPVSEAVRHDGQSSLWVSGDKANFDVTLNKYWINNPETVNIKNFNDYFNLYDGNNKLSPVYNEQENAYLVSINSANNVFKFTLALDPNQPTDNINKVKLDFNFTALKVGFSNNGLILKTKENRENRIIQTIRTYSPYALDPETSVIAIAKITNNLSDQQLTATVTWHLATTTIQGIAKNTYEWNALNNRVPQIVLPQGRLVKDGVELTNLQFNSSYTKIIGNLRLIEDKPAAQKITLDLSRISITIPGGTIPGEFPTTVVNVNQDSQEIVSNVPTYDYQSSLVPTRTEEGLWLPNDLAVFNFEIPSAYIDNKNPEAMYRDFGNYLTSTYNDENVSWTFDSTTNSFTGVTTQSHETLPYTFTLSIGNFIDNRFNVRNYSVTLKKNKATTQRDTLKFAISNNGTVHSDFTTVNGLGINDLDPQVTNATPEVEIFNLSEDNITANITYRLETLNINNQFTINTYKYLKSLGHELAVIGEENEFYHYSDLKINEDCTQITGQVTINKVDVTDQTLPLRLKVVDLSDEHKTISNLYELTLNIAKGSTVVNYTNEKYTTKEENDALKHQDDAVSFIVDAPKLLINNDFINHLVVQYTKGESLDPFTWTPKEGSENTYISGNNQYELTYQLMISDKLYNRENYKVTIKQISNYQIDNEIKVSLINQDQTSDVLTIKTSAYEPPVPASVNIGAILGGVFGAIVLIGLIALLIVALKRRKYNKK